MRFLVDECTGPAVASWLRDQNHKVFSVFDEARGADDDDINKDAAGNRRCAFRFERRGRFAAPRLRRGILSPACA